MDSNSIHAEEIQAIGDLKELSERERAFIDLVYVQVKTFDAAMQELGCTRAELSAMNWRLEKVWRPITAIRQLWMRKKIGGDFWDFRSWYLGKERTCHYCGVYEATLKKIIAQPDFRNKRPTRGATLELDRKHSETSYTTLDNLVLACYWCNNAKTDTFTEEEGKLIGEAISEIWKQRLAND